MTTPASPPPSPLSVGFVGAGRIAHILLAGWDRAQARPARVLAYDPDAQATQRLCSAHPGVMSASLADAAGCDVVFVGVHPPLAREVFGGVAALLGPHSAVVSMVPGAGIEAVQAIVGAHRALARVIPNAPSAVGAGFYPVAFGDATDAEWRAAVLNLLAPLGKAPQVRDEDLEAYAIVTAMGPTYLWPQLFALLDVAASAGLNAQAALEAITAMTSGVVATISTGDLDRQAVLDLIPSKPLADAVGAMSASYGAVLLPLHGALVARAGHAPR